MKKITPADPESRSADLLADNVDKLRELFPQAFTEGKVDFQVLRELLGDAVEEREERYGLNWHGKAQARRLALTPSTGTLRPVKEESVDWDTTQNLIIEGDNLEVLKLLQKSYAGKVKLIYIDPPYNTGNDFVYPDDYRDTIESYLRRSNQTDEEGFGRSTNSESSGRYHTDWLNMMMPRMLLARQLLSETGLIFVSLDDNEAHNLRLVLDSVFGPENFLAAIAWEKRYTRSNNARLFYSLKDTVLVYRKSAAVDLLREPRSEKADSGYTNPDNDPRGPWMSSSYVNPAKKEARPNLVYDITAPDGRVVQHETHAWKYSREEHERHRREGRLWWGQDGSAIYPRKKLYLSEAEGMVPVDLWSYKETGTTDDGGKEVKDLFDGDAVFDNPKPTSLIRRMITLATATNSGDLVLDFFAGSGSTADAVMRQNASDGGDRRYLLVQLPERTDRNDLPTIAHITRERVRRAGVRVKADMQIADSGGRDVGFRSFHLDSTNLRPWDPTPTDLQTQLGEHVDHIKPDRTEDDLLYEVLLKLGIDLSVPIKTRTIAGFEVHNIGAGQLLACFGTPICRANATPLARGITAWHNESRPEAADAAATTATLLFRDAAFEDDVAKQNLVHALEQAGLTNVRSL